MSKIIDNTTSRSLPVYKFTGFQDEILLSSVAMDEDFKAELKHCLEVGHYRDHPWIYYLCVFRDAEGLDLFPLPLLFEKENEQELTPWLTSCKQSWLAAIED